MLHIKNFSFLFLILSSLCMYAQEETLIMSYNTLDGHFRDSPAKEDYVTWVKKIQPDIIAYQEMNKFTQDSLEQLAKLYDHPYAVLLKEEGYPVALSSKYPIVNIQKVTENMHHGYLYVTTKDLHIFVLHLSPFSFQKRFEELHTILAHASSLPKDSKVLIMGDFNAFSRKDSGYYGKDLLESRKVRDKKYKQTNLNNGNLDFSVIDLISSYGYVDSYWLFNNNFKHTLPTNIDNSRVKRRIDYIWANDVMTPYLKESGIIHDESTDNLSDHYPIFIKVSERIE